MDNSIKSILDTVNQIVNKTENENNTDVLLAEHLEKCLDLFEEKFEIVLTEDQEDQLVEAALQHILNQQQAKQIDLNEDTIKIINENSPEEVFCYIVEWLAAAMGALGKATSVVSKAAEAAKPMMQMASQGQEAAKKLFNTAKKATSNGQEQPEEEEQQQQMSEDIGSDDKNNSYFARLVRLGRANQKAQQGKKGKIRRRGGEEQQAPPPESTTDWGSSLSRQIEKSQELPPTTRLGGEYTDYMSESVSIKKKKKVFKIIFVEKGVKKKGTAVSHKGVMRIVHGKQVFKVFDENNRDVTSQFKHKK